MTYNIKIAAVAAAMSACTCASFSAGATVSQPTSATGDVVFGEVASPISLVITPVAGLAAGPYAAGTTVADVQLTMTGTAQRVATKWAAATGTLLDATWPSGQIRVASKENAGHTVILTSVLGEGVGQRFSEAGGWTVSDSPVAPGTYHWAIETSRNIGTQTVMAGTYPVTVDAGIYTP
ncbi:TPA: hypothetical protein ON189_004583 [Serratia marcescens]|nr:hypothetical protein [Serratia marcescens]